MLFGPAMVGWAAVAGDPGWIPDPLLAARRFFAANAENKPSGCKQDIGIREISFILGMQVLPLVAALEVSALLQTAGVLSHKVDWLRGIVSLPDSRLSAACRSGLKCSRRSPFSPSCRRAIFLGDHFIRRSQRGGTFKKDLLTFFLVAYIPLPFIIVSVIAYPTNRSGILFALVFSPHHPFSPAVQHIQEQAGAGTPLAGAFHAKQYQPGAAIYPQPRKPAHHHPPAGDTAAGCG